MNIIDRINVAFNKFYANLLKDLKAVNDDMRQKVKKHYKVIDKLSSEYILYLKEQVGYDFINNDIKEYMKDKMIVKEITVDNVMTAITDSDADVAVFWNYIYILLTLLLIKKESESNDDAKQVELLFTTVIEIISKIQSGDDFIQSLDEILDDDIKNLLKNITVFKKADKPAAEIPDPFGGLMGDSMICNLAKEISSEIDISNIKVEKPEDVLKIMDFSGSNNIVGDIIKKVSSKIHDKINSGEMKQEDLFGEAMNMMNMMNMGGGQGGAGGMAGLFNNPMMTEMMKAMKKGKAVPRDDVMKKASTRDRLKAKLEERKKRQDS